tara:strand:+ start:601 stop:1230 length:630 start_codon:yes stop_codon:yes gene_type:complete
MSINSPFFYNQKLPQRGITPTTISSARTWLVSLNEAKEHLRIGHNEDDAYITRLTHAAQIVCEHLTGVNFTANTYEFTCDNWEQTKEVPEVSTISIVDKITYKDTSGSMIIWATSNYYLANGSQRSRIALTDGSSYPNLYDGIQNIIIEFTTHPVWGKGTYMNEVAFQAVLITISDMYENRQSVIVGRIASSIPRTAQFLLDTLKIQTL